jgi:hypothetical protein
LAEGNAFLAGPGADDVQGAEVFRAIMRTTIRLAVDGDDSLQVAVVRCDRVGDPILKAPLKGLRLQS